MERINFDSWFEVLNSLPYGVGVIGADDRLLWFNNVMGSEFGWQQDSIGQNAVECHKPEHQDRVRKIIEFFKQGEGKPIKMVYETKTHHRKLLTQYAPIYNGDGQYLGSTCSIVDISGR